MAGGKERELKYRCEIEFECEKKDLPAILNDLGGIFTDDTSSILFTKTGYARVGVPKIIKKFRFYRKQEREK